VIQKLEFGLKESGYFGLGYVAEIRMVGAPDHYQNKVTKTAIYSGHVSSQVDFHCQSNLTTKVRSQGFGGKLTHFLRSLVIFSSF
jgi:hypothetical protein